MNAHHTPETVTPFSHHVTDAQIADLRNRLAATNWPNGPFADHTLGQPVAEIQSLAEEWQQFDWRKAENPLAALPQFMTTIDGQNIHFVHLRSGQPDAFPLILTHGWPSSYAEFATIAQLLATPKGDDPAFDVVIPSLPGFAHSMPLVEAWDSARTAQAWDTLMKRLGYTRYGAFGSDVGALVTRELGILAPDGLESIHLQQIFAFPSGDEDEMKRLTPFEFAGFENLEKHQKYGGYADIQSKRPLTLGYGLSDSPVGLLAWMSELYLGFEGEHVEGFDTEAFLTQVSIAWFTGSAASAAVVYHANAASGAGYREIPCPTPTAVSVFPDDFRSVRAFAERSFSNIAHWSEMETGGHFAAVDVPDMLASEIRTAFGKYA